MIDSIVVRAYPQATGAKRQFTRTRLRRSLGGFTSKAHARCDNEGPPLGFVLTKGQASDYIATDTLMKQPVPNPKALLLHGILPVIPSRNGGSTPHKTDWRRYRDRNGITRMFNRLKRKRSIATCYDKTALSFMSLLNRAAAKIWIRSFSNAIWKLSYLLVLL